MRLRKEPEMDPSTRRELEALDAALAGLPVDPRDEELASLAVALREERPLPRPEFALDLDLRARDGFPAAEAARPAPRPKRAVAFRRRWALALGTVASLFIVATAVLTSGGGGDGQFRSASRDGAAPAKPETSLESRDSAPAPSPAVGAAPATAGGGATAQPDIAPVPPPTGGVAPRARERKVERGASLTLSTSRDEIENVADGAIRVTDRHGGFVLTSSVSSGEGTEAGATLDLRIPSARLQPALADLSELAHVRARTQDARDITAAFTSPRRRLSDALAERRGLLRQLARADTPNETAAVRARLRAVNRRIDRAQAELRRLRDRVSLAAVSVAIEPGGGDSGDGGGWSLGDAADDALGVLRALLGGALVALAVLVPAGLLGGAGWLAYRRWVRHRRERVLEA
jgi:Domain of unknown function (DUF4349)